MSLAAPLHSAFMKNSSRRLCFFVLAFFLCACVVILVLYNERITFITSSSFIKLKFCHFCATEDQAYTPYNKSLHEFEIDDRFDFDPEECNVGDGKWVFNSSFEPLYSDRTCPYLDMQVTCIKNGRQDFDYLHWEWQPEDCKLPRFDPYVALMKLRGKRLLFVGDSIQKGQWLSFVCLIESIIPEGHKSMKRGHPRSVFKVKEYNASIEFYWAPFLVKSNTDGKNIIADPKNRIINVDSVKNHAKNWRGVDILVFNTYVWWMASSKVRSLWGSYVNGKEGAEWLETPIAYRIGLKTWANWVDSNINPNRTRVFFSTMSPTHIKSTEWGKKDGKRCFNETKPVMKKGFRSSGADKQMMKEVATVIGKMKTPVSVLNITQISDYRIDGHASIWSESGGNLLTEEQKADPLNYADCIHWCLPGVPDTWNQLFLAYL